MYLVTGPTGNVGKEVVKSLRAKGAPVRVGMRSTKETFLAGVEPVELNLMRPETYAPAVRGIHGLFVLRPPQLADVKPTINVLIDRAIEADDCIYVPAGRGEVAWTDARDLGEVAAMALTDKAMRNQAYLLTGTEKQDFHETAALLSKALGRTIRYQPASALGYVRHLMRRGGSLGYAGVLTLLHLGIRRGNAAIIDPTMERLLGRKPRTIRDYIRDHLPLWRKPSAQAT